MSGVDVLKEAAQGVVVPRLRVVRGVLLQRQLPEPAPYLIPALANLLRDGDGANGQGKQGRRGRLGSIRDWDVPEP
jgi:hypothetical protein